jgi:hypothetical protein
MDSELTLKALSYAFVELLWLTALVLSLVSIRKESSCGETVKGIVALTLVIVGFCAFIALISIYAEKTRSPQKVTHHPGKLIVRYEAKRAAF